MASCCQKFKIILWKSYIIRRYHWFITLLELLVPLLLFFGIAAFSSYAPKNEINIAEQIYKEKEIKLNEDITLLYAPSNQWTERIMLELQQYLQADHICDVMNMSSEVEIEKKYKQIQSEASKRPSCAAYGIVFDESSESFSKLFNYKIRSPYMYDTTNMYSGFFEGSGAEKYLDTSFLAVQLAVDKTFMKLSGKPPNETFFAQAFPHPSVGKDDIKAFILDFLPFATVFSFIFLCPGVLKRVVEEKCSGVKELMKLMGLPTLVLWMGWLLHALVVAVVSITVIVFTMKIPFKGGDPVLLSSGVVFWIFLMLYCIATVFFLLAISALFKRPVLSMVFGILACVGTYVGFSFILQSGRRINWCCKILSSFLPNMALGWGYQSIFYYEKKNIGMRFVDVFSPFMASPDEMHLWQVWLMLIVQSGLYFLLTLYLEAIFPGDFGVAKPWYFPFTETVAYFKRSVSLDDVKIAGDVESETFEPLSGTSVGIKIRGLRKVFKTGLTRETKVAVDGVSMDILKEQITVLLGHNGAGKSTTMMVLTGMIPPTSGSVSINGLDISQHLQEVREDLGLCPQDNLLFPDLTVRQHLQFFAALKAANAREAEDDVKFFVEKLNLTSYLDNRPAELSGGYKRRLCLGIAFVGHSKTVILDEPTSGLDPEARREIWDLLLDMRGDRTILITTHAMEEADVLGDRIAIMDHGQVQCYGTPMFLKKLYGTGYVLSVLKTSASDVDKISDTVRRLVPDAELKTCVASLMTFRLPLNQTQCFPALFAHLQQEREALGVESVGVSITTLEEVFLRVGEIALEESSRNDDCISELSDKSEGNTNLLAPKNVIGLPLFVQQLKALLLKRYLVLSWSFVVQAILQVLMILLVTWLSFRAYGGKPMPTLKLNLKQYGSTHVLYGTDSSPVPMELTAAYKTLVGLGGSEAEAVPPGVDVPHALLDRAHKESEMYYIDYVVAAAFNASGAKLTALYSDLALHSVPVSLNLLTNALLKYKTGDDEFSISVSNQPFYDDEVTYLDKEIVSLLWMSLLPLCLTFWMGLFITLPLQERVSANKQLQLMAGVRVPLYWLSLFAFDLLMHTMLLVLLIMVVPIAAPATFAGSGELFSLFILLFVYGLCAIPFSYLISFWFNTWAGCYAVLVIMNLISGLIMRIVMSVLHAVDPRTAKVLDVFFRLIPNYSFTEALQVYMSQPCLYPIHTEDSRPPSVCPRTACSYLKVNETCLLYLGLCPLLYVGLVMLLDLGLLQAGWERVVAALALHKAPERPSDQDVQDEADQVDGAFSSKMSDMLVHDMKKKYGLTGRPPAVNGVSFKVQSGECFGLLGVNGAGKTTMFKMLTGAVVPTAGDASITGHKMSADRFQYLSQIGYCPQQDALIECLSASDLLGLFGSLRGVPPQHLKQEVTKWIQMMGLQEYRHKRSGTYSGGNKRKLSTAMALIGSPHVVFLDEPTSGVDPVARRNLWNTLIYLQKAGQSIVLTSHSMEECEALCNRLAIMVAGRLVCVGSIPYLKNKFKQGSTVKIKLQAGCGKEKLQAIRAAVEGSFRHCVIKDEHETLLHYHVNDPEMSWGSLFETMEQLKRQHSALEDYTISETSLEEVFLAFAQSWEGASSASGERSNAIGNGKVV